MNMTMKSWLVVGAMSIAPPSVACAQDRGPRLDPGIDVDSALVLLHSLNPDDHSTGAVILLGMLRGLDGVDDVARRDAIRGGLIEVAKHAPNPGARATALTIARTGVPGRVLLTVDETVNLVESLDDAGVRGVAIHMLGVHQDTAAALVALGRWATRALPADRAVAERAVLTMAEMGEPGRGVLRGLYQAGNVAPEARQALARLAKSDFRIRN